MRRMRVPLVILCCLYGALAGAASVAEDDYRRAMQRTPDAEAGERLFATCAACHGPDGAGDADRWVPRIGGERFSIIVRQLIDYRHGKRRDERMLANSAQHRLEDLQAIADVAGWVSHLSPPAPARGEPGPYFDLGRQLYSARCAGCHGERGEGKAGAPRLANQHAAYVVRQIRDTVDGRRPDLSAAHERLFPNLDSREIDGLADALMRQD